MPSDEVYSSCWVFSALAKAPLPCAPSTQPHKAVCPSQPCCLILLLGKTMLLCCVWAPAWLLNLCCVAPTCLANIPALTQLLRPTPEALLLQPLLRLVAMLC